MDQSDSTNQRPRRRKKVSSHPTSDAHRRSQQARPQKRRRPASAQGTRQGTKRSRTSSQATRPRKRQANARKAGGHKPSARQAARRPSNRNQQRRKAAPRRSTKLPLPLPALVGIIVAGCLCLFLVGGCLSRFDVQVNGETVRVDRGATIQTLLDKDVVQPKPGNLMAVDGSLLEEGGGTVCTATIDGAKAKLSSPLAAGNDISITDGADKTEKAEVTTETIPFEESEGDRSFEAYWYGSIHLLSDGQEGERTTTTGKKSGKTVTEVTKEPVDAGYRIYTASPDEKVLALTFDDGPWPDTTDEILDILEEYDAKATFFTIGEQISEYEDSVKRAHELGCQIATHTWDHAAGSGNGVSLATMSASEQVEEVEKGYAAIEDAIGVEPSRVMRAPGGNFYDEVISNLWDLVDAEIGWDVDTEDWSRPGSDAILESILSAKSGQVILMHDGGGDRSQTVEALRQAMPTLVERGFKFVTVDELMAYGMPSAVSSIPTTSEDTVSLDEA